MTPILCCDEEGSSEASPAVWEKSSHEANGHEPTKLSSGRLERTQMATCQSSEVLGGSNFLHLSLLSWGKPQTPGLFARNSFVFMCLFNYAIQFTPTASSCSSRSRLILWNYFSSFPELLTLYQLVWTLDHIKDRKAVQRHKEA